MQSSEERIDIQQAREDLDADHYALDSVKKRVLEFLAVRKLNPQLTGPILCFAGPPGVGKTSIAKSIARTLGREFHRISLGRCRFSFDQILFNHRGCGRPIRHSWPQKNLYWQVVVDFVWTSFRNYATFRFSITQCQSIRSPSLQHHATNAPILQ